MNDNRFDQSPTDDATGGDDVGTGSGWASATASTTPTASAPFGTPPPLPRPAAPGNRVARTDRPAGTIDETDRSLAVAAHLSPFLAAFVALSPLGPLLVTLLSSGRPYVRRNAVEALNFNLTMWIGVALSLLLMPILIGFLTLPFFGLMMLIFHIVGAKKAGQGVVYHYPMSVRFFS